MENKSENKNAVPVCILLKDFEYMSKMTFSFDFVDIC